jgi:hypothetical protein
MLETVLHELGHGIYELGFVDRLPWLFANLRIWFLGSDGSIGCRSLSQYIIDYLLEIFKPIKLISKADQSLKGGK